MSPLLGGSPLPPAGSVSSALAAAYALCLLWAPTWLVQRENNHPDFKLNTGFQRNHSQVHDGVMFIRAGSRKSRCRGVYMTPGI